MCDVHHYVNFVDDYSYTLSVHKDCIEAEKYVEDEFFECETKHSYVCTANSMTLQGAKEKLIDYMGVFIKEDVIAQIKEKEIEKELVN